MRNCMRSLRILLLFEGLILLAGSNPHLWAQKKKSSVTIDLQEYITMKQRLEGPSITTVESVVLEEVFAAVHYT